jgi:hypothetical protein
MAARTKIYNVWFWAPFHMLQAYPMARNLPIPDFLIPFAHLMWLPMYIAEHWTGLAAPVEDAWNMKSFTTPFSGILLLSFFYTTHGLSENQTLVKIGFVMYLGFMLFAGNLGFKGKPQSTQVSPLCWGHIAMVVVYFSHLCLLFLCRNCKLLQIKIQNGTTSTSSYMFTMW